MNGVLRTFRKRNIQANFYHFMLVVFVVVIWACLTCGLLINYFSLKSVVSKLYSNSKLPGLFIECDQVSAADENYLEQKYTISKRLILNKTATDGYKDFDAEIIVANGKISIPYIVDGDKGSGCFVDAKFAEKNHIGQNFSKITFEYTLGAETQNISFNVIGIMTIAEDLRVQDTGLIFIDENAFLSGLKVAFAGIDDADLSILKYNQVLIENDVSDGEIQQIAEYYESSSSNLLNLYRFEDTDAAKQVAAELKRAELMTYTVPSLFLLVSMLVIISAMSQLILQERYNIGLLKSFGINSKSIVANYAGYGRFFCVLGAMIGLAISPLFVPNFTFFIYDKIYNLPGDMVVMYCPWWIILAIVCFAGIIGYLSALISCLSILGKTPKECMNKSIKIRLKSRNKRTKLPTAFSVLARNIKLNISRTIMAIISISGGALLCLLGFGVEKLKSENYNIEVLQIFSKIFTAFALVLIVLSIIIFLIQIFKERTKEMAVLRLNGIGYMKIWVSVLLEMAAVSILSIVVSFILCGPVFSLMLNLFGVTAKFTIDFVCYLQVFAIVMAVTIVIAAMGIYKIFKLNINDTLKFSE